MQHLSLICESKNVPYPELMQAVEEFVDSMVEDASIELYEATAKRLLGESLNHDEIMLGVPMCGPDDLFVIEKAHPLPAENPDAVVFTDTQIRTILMRLKLGRKGLLQLYQTFLKMEKRHPNQGATYQMAKTAQFHGLPYKEVQLILMKMIRKHNAKFEHYLHMAEEVLTEEVPTNTQGSAMPNREATDGKPCGGGKPKKRKKLEDMENIK